MRWTNPRASWALGLLFHPAFVNAILRGGVVFSKFGLLLILAGSWLSTDGRVPPGIAALAHRARARTRARGSEAPG